MSKMLITGAGGFIGGCCANYFKDDYEIYAIDKNDCKCKNFIKGIVNLENLKAFGKKFDVIIHLAGSSTVGSAEKNPNEEKEKTIKSSYYLLEYIKHFNKNAKLIFSSSAAVYGDKHDGKIKEDDFLHPISNYGKDKLEVENLCKEYAINYGLNIKIARFFSIYGEGLKKQVLWDFSKRLFETNSKTLGCFGTGEEKRDFIHIKDVICFIDLLIKQNDEFEIYNCGSGKPCTIKDLLLKLIKCYAKNTELVFDNKIQQGNPKTLIADISKASAIGFSPKIDFDKGIEEYAKWFRAEN